MKEILVFRLSSLGDLILSTAFLENMPEDVIVDWVVSKEFEFVLRGHPRIRRLFVFDKAEGVRGWVHLIRSLQTHPYEARVDLHRTLRTRLAFSIFSLFDFLSGRPCPHFSISKERFRFFLLMFLKEATPSFLRPTPYWKRFATLAHRVWNQSGVLRPPSFLPLIKCDPNQEAALLQAYQLQARNYFTLMPASRWIGKQWQLDRWMAVVKHLASLGLRPLLLGRAADPACRELKEALQGAGVPFSDALLESDFKNTALLLKGAKFHFGVDTGLSHLAEAVGTPAVVVFGPTRPSLGFGPMRAESRSVELPLACAPCSKDGRHCYRFWAPYACMRGLDASRVIEVLK